MNRWLVLVLLAANLIVAGWLISRPPVGRPLIGEPAVLPLDVPRLTLVQELTAEDRRALERTQRVPSTDSAPPVDASDVLPGPQSAEIPTTAEVALPPVCATLGPFGSRSVALAVQRRLEDRSIGAELREEAGQLRSGFWVYLPPLPTRQAAEEMMAELKRREIGDLFIVTAADQRHAISLGLFSTPERADQRAAEIGKLGYRPRVAERFRDAAVYWLDFAEPGGVPVEVAGLVDPGLDPEPMRVEQPCPG
jgi:hypothetical protein